MTFRAFVSQAFTFATGLVLTTGAIAQHAHRCHTDQITARYASEHGLEADLQSFLEQPAGVHTHESNGRAVQTVPVVVHVVYNTPNENISDFQILGMINTMNEDFRRTNPDASQTRPQFVNDAADTEIEFCLATIDPNGNPTTGITRTQTTKTSWDPDFETDDMKFASSGGKNAWDPDSYLNVWVVDITPDPNGSTLGYAYLPFGQVVGSGIDGFVIDYQWVGYGERVATHEIGHYFGLRHPWGFQGGGCSDDDGINDTPNSSGPNFFCNLSATSCGSLDQIENYMDYADCTNMFTDDQSTLMNNVLSGVRSSLLSSTGCGVPTYTIPTSANGTTDGDFIDGVELESISNLNTGSIGGPTYVDYTAQGTDLAQEGFYTISITSGAWTVGNPDYYAAWVDWNQDLDFDDPGEKLGEFLSSATFTTEDINFQVPASALWGPTRLRVRGVFSGVPNIDPNFNYNYGETEDYTVTVIQPIAPVAALSVSSDTIVVGQTVDFIDESINFPTVWSWSISGVIDTMVTTQDLIGLQIDSAGCVDVYLQVVNSGGNDALFVDCAVYVKGLNENGYPLGVAPLDITEQLNLFPVPARGEVFLNTRNGNPLQGEAYLINPLGQVVQTHQLNASSNRLDLQAVAAGHYILRVVTDEGTAHFRLQRN